MCLLSTRPLTCALIFMLLDFGSVCSTIESRPVMLCWVSACILEITSSTVSSCRSVDLRSQISQECTSSSPAHLCHLVSIFNDGLHHAGVLTSDPRLVKSARPVPLLTYDEATELAFFGATVLHPQAMQPAFQQQFHNGHRLAVRVKNSYNR